MFVCNVGYLQLQRHLGQAVQTEDLGHLVDWPRNDQLDSGYLKQLTSLEWISTYFAWLIWSPVNKRIPLHQCKQHAREKNYEIIWSLESISQTPYNTRFCTIYERKPRRLEHLHNAVKHMRGKKQSNYYIVTKFTDLVAQRWSRNFNIQKAIFGKCSLFSIPDSCIYQR